MRGNYMETKSPIKSNQLHNPGQSLDDQIYRIEAYDLEKLCQRIIVASIREYCFLSNLLSGRNTIR